MAVGEQQAGEGGQVRHEVSSGPPSGSDAVAQTLVKVLTVSICFISGFSSLMSFTPESRKQH